MARLVNNDVNCLEYLFLVVFMALKDRVGLLKLFRHSLN
jgi:hypothetical protein